MAFLEALYRHAKKHGVERQAVRSIVLKVVGTEEQKGRDKVEPLLVDEVRDAVRDWAALRTQPELQDAIKKFKKEIKPSTMELRGAGKKRKQEEQGKCNPAKKMDLEPLNEACGTFRDVMLAQMAHSEKVQDARYKESARKDDVRAAEREADAKRLADVHVQNVDLARQLGAAEGNPLGIRQLMLKEMKHEVSKLLQKQTNNKFLAGNGPSE